MRARLFRVSVTVGSLLMLGAVLGAGRKWG
jgi:hypothetical protein